MSSLISFVRHSSKVKTLTTDCLLVGGGSLLLALFSQFSVPLWFSPVPLSLQSLAVLLLGGMLGSKRATLAVLLYLAEGSVGLPFFATGIGGFVHLYAATGGYLWAFALAAFLVGYLCERGWRESSFFTLLAMGLGSLLILSVGALWLSFFVGFEKAPLLGIYPFLIGDALKSLGAATVVATGAKLLNKLR